MRCRGDLRDQVRKVECGGMELRGPDLLAQLLCCSDQLWSRARCDGGVRAQVVEIQCFPDRPDQFCQSVLLEFRDVRLAGQGRHIDGQRLGDRGHQVRAGRLVAGLHLREQAVRVRDPLGQPALREPRSLPVLRDPGAYVFVVAGQGHATLHSVTRSPKTLPVPAIMTTTNAATSQAGEASCGPGRPRGGLRP